MNERIKELAKGLYKNGPIGKDGWPEYQTFDEQKFAELIIKECLDKISGLMIEETLQNSDEMDPYWKWNLALAHAEFEIEQHFFGDQE